MRDASIVETVQHESAEVIVQSGDADAGCETSPSRRKRRSSEEIRARLLDAAREEFKARGFARATTAAIARRADVAEIQMFRYFATKTELFHEAVFTPLLDHMVEFHAQHTPDDTADLLNRSQLYLGELLAFMGENARILISLLAAQSFEQSGAGPEQGLKAYFDETVNAMVRRTGVPVDANGVMSMRVGFGALLGCITYRDWLFPEGSAEPRQIDTAITEFVLNGLGSGWYTPPS